MSNDTIQTMILAIAIVLLFGIMATCDTTQKKISIERERIECSKEEIKEHGK